MKYINWLYTNIPQSKSVEQDKLYREIINKELRIVSMKITDIDILFVIGLNNISLEDFTIDKNTLIKKIISENPDKNDLDLLYRILAQVMTKLPMDLKNRVTGKQKLEIFQSVSKFINMEPKLLEKFISFNPSLNTPITMELESGDYNTLNKKYLDELKKFQNSQPYVDSNSMEYEQISQKMLNSTPSQTGGNIKGRYIDSSPDLMTGVKDNKLYYFDSSSGTISEIQLEDNKQIPVSKEDIITLLSENKVDKNQIKELINSLNSSTITKPNVPVTTHPISFLNSLGSLFSFGSSNLPLNTSSSNASSLDLESSRSNCPPIPPQFVLSQSSQAVSQQAVQQAQQAQQASQQVAQQASQQLTSQQLTYQQLDKYLASLNSNYNPKDFINPTFPNMIPQQTSNFLTRDDACSLPNPPARCPAKTVPSVTNNSILEKRFQLRDSTYKQQISGFSNMNNDSEFKKKIAKNNKDIENVAIAFVSVIILLFLLVIFNSIRDKSGIVNPKK